MTSILPSFLTVYKDGAASVFYSSFFSLLQSFFNVIYHTNMAPKVLIVLTSFSEFPNNGGPTGWFLVW